MSMLKPLALLALTCALAAPARAASDDDDLTPLTPIKKAPPKAPPPAKKAPPPVVKKAPVVPKKGSGDDDLTPLTPIAARGELNVRVNAAVQGAVLSIDGKEIGALPLGPQALSTGEHLVSVKRPGFAAFVKKVQIGTGKSIDLEAKMSAVAAVLSVSSDVPNAQVFVNGRSIGIAPISDYEVPAGTIELSVLKEGFREDKQKLTLVAGKDYPVVVKFAPPVLVSDRPVDTTLVPNTDPSVNASLTQTSAPPPLTQRWYFWAGVVVVVAAAVATGTAIAVSANQGTQQFTANQICGASGCATLIK